MGLLHGVDLCSAGLQYAAFYTVSFLRCAFYASPFSSAAAS